MEKVNIVMAGPSPEEKGGMGSVTRLIIDAAGSSVLISHISTWEGSDVCPPIWQRIRVFLQALGLFVYRLLFDRVDLVHIHLAERGSVARKSILTVIAVLLQKPVVMHTHGCEFHLFHRDLPQFARWAINWILQQCDCVIVLSDSWKQFYVSQCYLSPEKVVVLHNPVVLPQEIPLRSGRAELRFVFLGKVNQRKGVYDLVNALGLMAPEERKQVRVTLAGVGEVEQVRRLAESLQVDDRIDFPGWITPEQRDCLLAEADAFLLPSYNEGLPMAILEAMSWGLPVIATPVGGIPEVISHRETGLLVEPGNVEQLATAICSLVNSQGLRLSLGRAAHQRVLPFDQGQYSRTLFRLYDSILTRKRSRVPVNAAVGSPADRQGILRGY
ncbi:MAG: glycosyltransferase family 4 protein [Microcoleaceae cyanobacterium]